MTDQESKYDGITFKCSECGSPLMPTESGSACPNGHGKLHGKMPAKEQRCNSARLLFGAPEMFSLPSGTWTFQGAEGRRFRRCGKSINRKIDNRLKLKEGQVVGINDDKVYIFEAIS